MDKDKIRELAKEIYSQSPPVKHDFDDTTEECVFCGMDITEEDNEPVCEVALIELMIHVILKTKSS